MIKGILFTALGAACAARGLLRPVRAVVRSGEIRRCAGPNSFDVCDPTLGIRTAVGEKVHANAPGKVVVVGEDYVHVMATNEPVILMYQGLVPAVRANQRVGPGQALGASAGNITFSVTQMGPGGTTLIEPAAWLASRGQKAVLRNSGDSTLWCAQGRHIVVPREARQSCGFRTPEKAGFALLPVSTEMN